MKRTYSISKEHEGKFNSESLSDLYRVSHLIMEEVDICGVPVTRCIKNRDGKCGASMFADLIFKMRRNEHIEKVINWV